MVHTTPSRSKIKMKRTKMETYAVYKIMYSILAKCRAITLIADMPYTLPSNRNKNKEGNKVRQNEPYPAPFASSTSDLRCPEYRSPTRHSTHPIEAMANATAAHHHSLYVDGFANRDAGIPYTDSTANSSPGIPGHTSFFVSIVVRSQPSQSFCTPSRPSMHATDTEVSSSLRMSESHSLRPSTASKA